MRLYIFMSTILASLLIAQCSHMFIGTSVMRNQAIYKEIRSSQKILKKSSEIFNFQVPASYYGRNIQGILAYDDTKSSASANITAGGVGYSFVSLRMESERGKKLKYNVYIYV